MILTVTVNASLDRLLFIPEFAATTNMRVQKNLDAVGGKGFDTSVALRCIGVETTALGFVAGRTGEQLVELLHSYGIQPDLLWVEGDTRIAHVVIETTHHRHSHITSTGYSVSAADLERFVERYRGHLGTARWVIMSGSLPPGAPADFYARLVMLANQKDASTVVDCAGKPSLQAAAQRPTILKMNRAELAQSYGVTADNLPALNQRVRKLAEQRSLANVVITCGADGILAVTEEGSHLAIAPLQQEVSAAGAGDAVSGCLAWRLGQGDDWPSALRWAAATGAAVVLCERTAECRREDVNAIYPQVTVTSLGGT